MNGEPSWIQMSWEFFLRNRPQHWPHKVLEYTCQVRQKERTLEDLVELMQQEATGINKCLQDELKYVDQEPELQQPGNLADEEEERSVKEESDKITKLWKRQIIRNVREILQTMDAPSKFATFESKPELKQKKIKDWTKEDIQHWVKESECFSVTAGSVLMDHDRLQEAIAVINHGVRLIRGFNLRNTQIIALWVYLSNNGERGRLGQISTGEGKSLIIACLASIYSLGGRLVHRCHLQQPFS